MGVPYLGDFAEDATVHVMFNTFTSDDPSASCTITNFINTDVHIHKNALVAQRNNAAGITVSVNFDGITGSHMIVIDTNDDTVGGFWVTGADYFVRIEGTTVDGATINVVVAHFSIENRYNPVTDYDGPTKAEMDTAHGLLATEAKQDIIDNFLDTEIAAIVAAVISNAAGVDIAADIIALKAVADAIPTTAMRGTDNAALASVVGALNDVAADGDPTDVDTLVKYVKQLINILIGTAGVVAFPAEGAPANAVSLAEVIRAIHVDVTGLNGDAMRGTNGANTTVPDAAGIAAGLHGVTDGLIGTLVNLTAQNVRDAMKLAPAGGVPAAGSVDKHLDDIEADSDELQTNQGNWLTAVGFSVHDAAAVKTAIEAAGSHLTLIKAVTDLESGVKAAVNALNNLSAANVNTEVDAALNTTIPAAPTVDSINEYIQILKYVLVNKIVITEATGNTKVYKDNDVAEHCDVPNAFDSDGVDTTRKRLE